MLKLTAFMGIMLWSAGGSTLWEEVLQPVRLSACMPFGPLSNQNVGKGWSRVTLTLLVVIPARTRKYCHKKWENTSVVTSMRELSCKWKTGYRIASRKPFVIENTKTLCNTTLGRDGSPQGNACLHWLQRDSHWILLFNFLFIWVESYSIYKHLTAWYF